jgi:hypothetical protein
MMRKTKEEKNNPEPRIYETPTRRQAQIDAPTSIHNSNNPKAPTQQPKGISLNSNQKPKTHRKPFLNRLDTCLRYLILPVPVVFLRLAFWPHSYDLILAEGYPHWPQATKMIREKGQVSIWTIESGDQKKKKQKKQDRKGKEADRSATERDIMTTLTDYHQLR